MTCLLDIGRRRELVIAEAQPNTSSFNRLQNKEVTNQDPLPGTL